ncbi:hypothetical protein GCM10027275_43660 [Rhabdobacter roseus]|uniref:Putative glyoxalase superfamily protein PhnB n=1 Tax=Rhabdobacter roseus TaxID=1655419 RepID=A0A840U2J5_9BACT|nr:VOC family protein [Rhabdobacter roseus]MBB5286578.1 putative glyoxalase superfamily protein PhnB [Rhabdobacter roseus]
MKKVSHILNELRSSTPFFTIREADEFIRFLEEGLRGQETYCERRPDGSIGNALVLVEDNLVEISEANLEYPERSIAMQLRVEDPEACRQQMIRAGARPVVEPAGAVEPRRQSVLVDPWGNQWYLSRHTDPYYLA